MLLRVQNNKNVYVFDEQTTILVVDDDPILREFAMVELASPRTQLLCASDGLEALERLRERHVDIVLSDLHMPGLDGFGMLLEIRRDPRLKHIPVVMATTRDDMFAIDRAYEVGATSFVTKPVNWRLIGHQMRYVMRMHRIETDLRRARDEAEAAAALKNNIVGLMSHETRTPLGVILGFAGMIASQAHGPVGHADYLAYAARIVESGERLYDTLGALQLFAEISVASMRPALEKLPLDEIAQAALRDARLGPDARRRVTLAAGLTETELRCDPRLMAAALKQLVRNAVRHAGEDCQVRIGVEARPDGDTGVIVEDDGRGMDAAAVQGALRPFLEREGGLLNHGDGLGIGLPIARCVAELHGGRLEVRSAPGIGTGVSLVMPGSPADQGRLRSAA